MKTPREVLFGRHRGIEPKLDAVRHRALAGLAARREAEANLGLSRSQPRGLAAVSTSSGTRNLGAVRRLWLELIWPCRRAWAGLAVIWLALLVTNLEMKGPSGTRVPGRPTVTIEAVRSLVEQRRFLAELLGPVALPAPEPARPAPGPRSERPRTTKIV